jgi:hypothetical protein
MFLTFDPPSMIEDSMSEGGRIVSKASFYGDAAMDYSVVLFSRLNTFLCRRGERPRLFVFGDGRIR